MVANSRIGDLIRENRVEEISEAIAEGAFFQMQTFTSALIDLVLSGEITREVAADSSTNKHDFLVALEYASKRQAAGLPETLAEEQGVPEPEPVEEEEQPLALRVVQQP